MFQIKKIMPVFFAFSLLFFGMVWASENELPPWLDLEKRLQTSEKKILEVEAELQELLKKKPQFATDDEKRLHFEKIRSLREEKKELLEDIDRIKRDLKFRFPERGVVRKTKAREVENEEGSSSQDVQASGAGDSKKDKPLSEGPNPKVLNELKSVLKQSYGVSEPSPSPARQAPQGVSGLKKDQPSQLPSDSIFAPLVIKKEQGENP